MFFSSTKTSIDLEQVIQQTHMLFVCADKSLVAIHGRERLEQFCATQGQQPTADIERFIAAQGLTGEELIILEQKISERQAYHTNIITRQEKRLLLELLPVDSGEVAWLLMIRSSFAPTMIMPRSRTKNDAEAVLHTEDGGWRRYVEDAPVPTALISGSGLVMQVNAAFQALLPLSYKGRKNWRFLECIAADSKENVASFFMQALEGKIKPTSALEIKMEGSEEETLSLYISRLDDAEFIVQLIDLTEQKNLEMRFAHSQKMQAVGQLAGGIAHDFNNLLTAMIGFSDLLLMRHPAGDQSFADIMQIKQNANRAANLVRQLLAFSRQQTLKTEQVSITDSLADLANLIRRLIGENIIFTLQHGRDIWPVLADQGQLEQVMINLCVNARDAMNGTGNLTICTANISIDATNQLGSAYIFPVEDDVIQAGEYVRIDIDDSGQGISSDLCRKIFEPFFSTKEVGAGTGLGLSTVYGIIKQTGGYICVRSEVGKGTRFSLFFRRYIPTIQEAETQKTGLLENDEPAAPIGLTGSATILLVEDEAPVRIFSARALRNKGYKVLEADCGEAAMRVIAENQGKLDLIISDVVMPGQTGPAMVEEIAIKYPDIKVIFISGYAEDAFIKTYGESRSFNFLPKPFSLKQLAVKVKAVLEDDQL